MAFAPATASSRCPRGIQDRIVGVAASIEGFPWSWPRRSRRECGLWPETDLGPGAPLTFGEADIPATGRPTATTARCRFASRQCRRWTTGSARAPRYPKRRGPARRFDRPARQNPGLGIGVRRRHVRQDRALPSMFADHLHSHRAPGRVRTFRMYATARSYRLGAPDEPLSRAKAQVSELEMQNSPNGCPKSAQKSAYDRVQQDREESAELRSAVGDVMCQAYGLHPGGSIWDCQSCRWAM